MLAEANAISEQRERTKTRDRLKDAAQSVPEAYIVAEGPCKLALGPVWFLAACTISPADAGHPFRPENGFALFRLLARERLV